MTIRSERRRDIDELCDMVKSFWVPTLPETRFVFRPCILARCSRASLACMQEGFGSTLKGGADAAKVTACAGVLCGPQLPVAQMAAAPSCYEGLHSDLIRNLEI